MHRALLIIFAVFLTASVSSAQRQVFGVDFGQSYAYFHRNSNDNAKVGTQPFSLGNGRLTGLSYRYYPDSANWFFSTGLDWFQGNQVEYGVFKTDTQSSGGVSRSLSALRFNVQLNYLFRFRPFNLEIKAGITLPMIGRSVENSYYSDTFGTTTTSSHYKYFPSLGFKGGLGLSRKINDEISCFLNLEINVLNQSVKYSKIIAYDDPWGRELNSVFPNTASREALYRRKPEEIRNNKDVLSARFDPTKPTDKASYSQTMTGTAIRFGFLFHF